jgi:hypothetical protein
MIPSALAEEKISAEANVTINIASRFFIFIILPLQHLSVSNDTFNLIERRKLGLKSSNGIIPARN